MMPFSTVLLVAAGGAIGTVCRYLLAIATAPLSQSLPWGTIGINVAGSFIIGFAGTLTLASGRFPLGDNARLFIMVGFCGGFTTFSSFSLQTLDLLRAGAGARALLNIALSVLLCVAAVALGHYAAGRINEHRPAIAQSDTEELG